MDDAHLAPIASVAGQSITKDQLTDRLKIEGWRLQEQERRIANQVASGRLTDAQAEQARQILSSQAQQIEGLALERIIDNRIQANLATAEGVSVSDADIDAKLVEEATTPAARHLWAIEVAPAVSDGALEPTPAQVAEARTKANDARADIEGGAKWEDVAKSVSTDVATRDQGGDLGWVLAEDRSLDEGLLKAAFEVEPNALTEVIEGEDGVFRIGRVTEAQDDKVDELYQTKMQNEGVDLAKYREVVRGDVIRTKLEDKIVADVTKPGPQRQVSEIYIPSGDVEVPESAVKVRHILFSPNNTVPDSAASPLPSDDPAWEKAKADADAAYAKLKVNPELFDEMARTESDETGALGTTGSGGKLPGYIAPDDTQYVPEFVQAIHADNPTDGEVLAPFKSSFGWHVVQVMYHPPDQAQMEKIKTEADGGGDFAQLARDFSESADERRRRRSWLDRTRPARPAAGRRDLRGTDRQDERDRQRRPTTGCTSTRCSRSRSGPPRAASSTISARTRSATGTTAKKEQIVIDRGEGQRLGRCSTRWSPRHGCAGGSTLPPASRSLRPSASSRRPFEASRPLLVVPLATLRTADDGSRRRAASRQARTRRT